MRAVSKLAVAVVGMTMLATTAPAREKVGEATLVKTTVSGDSGPLAVKAPVHRDERIRTSSSGLGEFLFRDGTKFAVGGNSSVVIDKFVFDDGQSAKKLTIKAAKGSLRWISGLPAPRPYEIVTPAGTLGIRGTAFDVHVGANGTTAVVLLSGSARFCGSNGCRMLTRRCDVVVARPGVGVTDPRRVDRSVLSTLGSQRALPFLTGAQRLSSRFRVGGGCSLAASFVPGSEPRRANEALPERRAPDGPRAVDPPGPDPDPPAPEPDPDPPEKPKKDKNPNNGRGNGGGDGSPGGNAGNDGD